MDRREFLLMSLGAAVLAAPAREDDAAHPDLLSLLGPQRVREIGLRYRRLVPTESDRARLRAAILQGGGGGVRSDFDAGRTVLVNGWVLSATEARQCALFSLRA